jgi:serine/threonine protein kinase
MPYRQFTSIGMGGYCQVYRAWDHEAQRAMALKVPRTDLTERQRELAAYQIRREAHLLMRLSHPAILSPHAYDAQVPLLALPYLDGYSLEDIFAQNRRGVPLDDILFIGQHVCAVLAYLAQQKIVFCDLSAKNIMIAEGSLYLIDFGLAQQFDEARPVLLSGVGTPGFAPPELYPDGSSAISPASDIYGLGALLHFACSGEHPARAPVRFTFSALPAYLPRALCQLIFRMLDPRPACRPRLLEVHARLAAMARALV